MSVYKDQQNRQKKIEIVRSDVVTELNTDPSIYVYTFQGLYIISYIKKRKFNKRT